jgi:predicted metal-binding transcription factor (methanogenesis marker protein 9)
LIFHPIKTDDKYMTNSKIPNRKELLRDLPNWSNAPVPICLGGDYRALTFCCKPGFSLSFAAKCLRDKTLDELEMSAKEFMEIKDQFSKVHVWNGQSCCFGSLSYCCIRKGGCSRRDPDIEFRYPKLTEEQRMAEYFRLKKQLAREILLHVKDKAKIKDLLEFC